MPKRTHDRDTLRRAYNFAAMMGGVRGKYADRLAEGSNVVVLDDDVAAAFPTDAAVNEALRAVLMQRSPPMKGVQFVVDETGWKTGVYIDLLKNPTLWEVLDFALVRQRANDRRALASAKERLSRAGKLSRNRPRSGVKPAPGPRKPR